MSLACCREAGQCSSMQEFVGIVGCCPKVRHRPGHDNVAEEPEAPLTCLLMAQHFTLIGQGWPACMGPRVLTVP